MLRLYYTDAYLQRFTAQVVERTQRDGQPAIRLDQSAFYPEGGGQPADHGWLGGVRVVDVQTINDQVWHFLDADEPLPAEVEGLLDWPRRFDHMQQHLGQHLLTAAFIATSDLPTVAFHMGSHVSTIDLDIGNLTAAQLQAAETYANRVVWEDHPVIARFVDSVEVAQLPLRKPPSVTGPIRVVSVPAIDYSACGGTHPRTTGGVGMIAVTNWSRMKGGVRVEFVCGGRALRDYGRMNGIVRRAAASISVGSDELEVALGRLKAQGDGLRKENEHLRDQLLDAEASRYYAEGVGAAPRRLVCATVANADGGKLRELARRIAAYPGGVAILGSSSDGRATLVIACANESGCDARPILQAGLALVGGRGGGSMGLAQGAGSQGEALTTALAAMREVAEPRR